MAQYDAREAELGDELMRALERYLLLTIIDERWREHLYDMDYLREGIHLRGFAQIDPLVAYKNEAYTLFTDLMNTVWSDFARMIFHVEVQVQAPNGMREPQPVYQPVAARRGQRTSPTGRRRDGCARDRCRGSGAALAEPGSESESEDAQQAFEPVEQRHLSEEQQLGRNDPCWCGSGKKFKRCHGA